MLLRTGRQLELLFRDSDNNTGCVATLVTQGAGLAECMAYAAYNTPAFARANSDTFAEIISILDSKERRFYKLPAGLPPTHMQSAEIIVNSKNPVYTDRETEIRAYIDKQPVDSRYVFLRYQCNGHASYLPKSHGEYELTTVISETNSQYFLVGQYNRRDWYSYCKTTGVVPLHKHNVRHCINALANPKRIAKRKNDSEQIERYYVVYVMYERPVADFPLRGVAITPKLLDKYHAGPSDVVAFRACDKRNTVCGRDGVRSTLIPHVDRTFSTTRPIRNIGNTCWVNAAMQILARLDGLEDVEQHDNVLPSFLLEMFSQLGDVIPPRKEFITRFAGGTIGLSDDPCEFIDYLNNNYAAVTDFFEKNIQYTVHSGANVMCESAGCGGQVYKEEHFPCIFVLIGAVHIPTTDTITTVDLNTVLDLYQKSERVQTEIRMLTCNRVKEHMQAVNVAPITIESFSRYILLKFQPASSGGRKKEYSFKDTDDFTMYDSDAKPHKFKIVAMIFHIGGAGGGHYITMAKNKHGKNEVYDDSRKYVSPTYYLSIFTNILRVI